LVFFFKINIVILFKEFHIDRGDAQRAAEYYAELAVRNLVNRICIIKYYFLGIGS